ncbi:MAG TPA: DUF1015 domain-containing protein [Candidatus Kapabacteria bacterium]|nr:DUF1015 domain-containing protein [Candidatus Kapabacteria bacterium]
MPPIVPFAPYRYNLSIVNDPGAVIAPPYDVISPARRAALLEADPHNVIQLILPEGDSSTRYEHAAELLRSWIASGVLEREKRAAFFPYAQTFIHPVSGERIERRGFVSLLRLSPFSAGEVLPHERTLSGPKADRLELMRSTAANLEAIFGVYRDPSGASSARLAAICSSREPIIRAVDGDGVEHRMWRASEPQAIHDLTADLATQQVFIVDGHHRYETALDYQRIRRSEVGEGSGEQPFDWMMVFLAPTSDPGLLILPTHRVVRGLADFSADALLAELRPHFHLVPYDSRAEALAALQAGRGRRPSFLLASDGGMMLASLRDDADAGRLVDADRPAALRHLDVTILHDHILNRLLGITPQMQVEQRNLAYVKNASEALDAVSGGGAQLAVLMNEPTLEQVEAVAESGAVMPQKSTYFYPKLASGMLFNPLW